MRTEEQSNDEGKILETPDKGDGTGFWFYAGPGSNKTCLELGSLRPALFAVLWKTNQRQRVTDEGTGRRSTHRRRGEIAVTVTERRWPSHQTTESQVSACKYTVFALSYSRKCE